jgi:hypothetical protein
LINARSRGDDHRAEIAEQRVSTRMQRVRRAALALDRLVVERGDEDGRRRLVEGALRLTENTGVPLAPPNE